MFSSAKSLKSHKWIHSDKNPDPDVQYPETEEGMLFFGAEDGSWNQMHAFDRNFFTFRNKLVTGSQIHYSCSTSSCQVKIRTTKENKILYRRGNHNHDAMPALIQVKKLESDKMEEILRNPKSANAKNLLVSISKEILSPEMAAFASSYQTLAVRLRRRLKKMKNAAAPEIDN